jgi:hypothetical protein
MGTHTAGAGPVSPAPDAPDDRGQVIHIHPAARRAAKGAPCNGCGVCCLVEPARSAIRARTGACDALRWDGAQRLYRCGAISDAEGVLGSRWRWAAPLLRRFARRWIAAGIGCDASLQSQR